MGIAAGRLRHRINIQRKVEVQDPVSLEIAFAWTDLFSDVPAAIEPLSVKDLIAAQAEQSQLSARITIRYRAGITQDMRIEDIGKGVYYFLESDPLPDKESGLEYITLAVKSGTNRE